VPRRNRNSGQWPQQGSIRRSHVWPDGPPPSARVFHPVEVEHPHKSYPEFAPEPPRPRPTGISFDDLKGQVRARGVHPALVSTVAMRERQLQERSRPVRPVQVPVRSAAKPEPPRPAERARGYVSFTDGLALLAEDFAEAS
jgi:hypothetical protein